VPLSINRIPKEALQPLVDKVVRRLPPSKEDYSIEVVTWS
jgi:hypothetical protein